MYRYVLQILYLLMLFAARWHGMRYVSVNRRVATLILRDQCLQRDCSGPDWLSVMLIDAARVMCIGYANQCKHYHKHLVLLM